MLAPNRLVSLVAPLLLATLQLHCTSDAGFQCSSDADDCGEAGFCESTGFCSFDDPGCASGRRYGDLAEALSNQCVPPQTGTGGLSTSTGPDPTGTVASTTTDPDASEESTSALSVGLTTDSTASTGEPGDGTSGSSGSSTSSEETTGGAIECQLEAFDMLPGKPGWFNFGDVGVEGGQLRLDVDVGAPPDAGLRTALPIDLTAGSVTAVITELPGLDVATSSFVIVDETFNNENGYSFSIINGVLRAERSMGGPPPLILQSESIDSALLPVTLRFETLDGELTMTATAADAGAAFLTWTEDAPDWLGDLYVSVSAGNPSPNPTAGHFEIDSLELCPPIDF